MEGTKIGLLVSRILQLISGAVVLGVAAKLAADFNDAQNLCDQYCSGSDKKLLNSLLDKPKPSIEYAAFTGAWGLLGALVTLVAVFVDAIPWVVALGFDGLASIFYLAGGINNAVQRSQDDLFEYGYSDNNDGLNTRWDATTAFMFIGFIASIAALVLVFLSRRSGGGVRHSAV